VTDPVKIPIPDTLPLLVLSGSILFPHERLTLELKEEGEIAVADAALSAERFLAVFPTANGGGAAGRGTAARIEQMRRREDGAIWLSLAGVARIDRIAPVEGEPVPVHSIRPAPIREGHELRIEALRRNCLEMFDEIIRGSSSYANDLIDVARRVSTAGHLADLIVSHLRLSYDEKLAFLNEVDVELRLEALGRLLARERKIAALENRIKERVESALGDREKEQFLRQQIDTIRQELGEEDEREVRIREMDRRIAEVNLPAEVRQACRREVLRLSRIPVESAEFTITRTHIDWTIGLPWTNTSTDTIHLDTAREILEKNHYGLDKIKERVLEFLAVRKLKEDSPSPLLCFVGPPGVGKTSLGISIAEALGRKVAHLPLGGVTDESEIRGHRRTYSGALPGRILQELRRVGVRNPLFMLDEIDKLGSHFRGDPSASLLEVLDPEQNRSFADNYVNLPFDLSEVFFISTANSIDSIPAGLLDRLEIIEFPGYTTMEKLVIAERYLVPKQVRQHGLSAGALRFHRRAIRRIIDPYAVEAGLRDLERCLAAVCRKRAVAWLEGKKDRTTIREEDIPAYLGTPRYYPEIKGRKPEVGLCTALAWTPAGGQILFIEATLMPGRQSLQLTGHLGDVMRESAETSISFVRSFLDQHGAPPELLENHDLHIHVPAGSIAKDGPSAGIAIATAVYSLVTGLPVRHNVAMTGEITLRGHVLPVGGVKQKIFGAYRTGIRTVILPARNVPELAEVPDDVMKKIHVIPVERIEEVFAAACIPRRRKGG